MKYSRRVLHTDSSIITGIYFVYHLTIYMYYQVQRTRFLDGIPAQACVRGS